MEEVQNHIGPLRIAVESQGRTLRSLYSNGSGGPPGYLEKARDEDKEWKNEMFLKLDEFLKRLGQVERFVVIHQATEAQIVIDRKELNRKLNIKLIIVGLVISVVSILSANISSCKNAAKSFLADPNHSTLSLPQNSQTMPEQAKEEPGPINNKTR